ncbi:MAG: hypothetical protein KIG76_05890 [Eubacteriales bacterium]|nr:hypothetical protein [Candidatus Colimorpha enterica]
MNSENNTRKRVPKPVKRRQKAKRVGSGFVLLILAAVLAIGGTLAYIIANTVSVENKFTPGEVRCEVLEDFDKIFDKITKSNVRIKNTGNTAAYIRATYVVTWQKEDGTVNGKMPVVGTDYTIEFAENSGWELIGDYWYYTSPVAAGGETGVLIASCKLAEGAAVPKGYHLSVEIIASAIQSEPASVVAEKWHVAVDNGEITGAAASADTTKGA